MRKEIKKYGNSAVIVLDVEDLRVYDLGIGDVIDVSDIVKVKRLHKVESNKVMLKSIKEEIKRK